MAATDPIRALQLAARNYALAIDPNSEPKSVRVVNRAGEVIGTLTIPARVKEDRDESPLPSAGWLVTDSEASYDGTKVRVAPSRLGLLRLLLDATAPIPVAKLADDGWPPHESSTGEPNVRQHVARLNTEIRAAVPGLDFDPIEGTGQGYRLVFR